jgi:peptidoglycan hydrolase-like protein with peptidoglycan-binding domain
MKLSTVTIAALLSLVIASPSFAQQTPISQIDVNTVPKLNPDGVRKVQGLLRDKGFAPGPNDGIAGPLTKSAVRSFQEKYGMKPSGEIDNQLLLGLGAVDLAGTAE